MDYYDRIQNTLDYIEEYIAEELSLSRLAAIACFSDFHFHRVFQATYK